MPKYANMSSHALIYTKLMTEQWTREQDGPTCCRVALRGLCVLPRDTCPGPLFWAHVVHVLESFRRKDHSKKTALYVGQVTGQSQSQVKVK